MAGNLPVANTTEVKLVWAHNAVPTALNILHWTHPVAFAMTQAVADSISGIIKAAFTTSGQAALIASTVTLLRVEARNMDSNTDPWFIGAGSAVPGSSAANPLPAATALVATISTGLRGRSYKGRVYLWGYTEDANDAAGGATAAAQTAANSFLNTIVGNMTSTHNMSLAVLSRFTTPPGSPPGTPAVERNPPIRTAATGVGVVDLRWDVQRRRANPGI